MTCHVWERFDTNAGKNLLTPVKKSILEWEKNNIQHLNRML
jgi:hypothetical protein